MGEDELLPITSNAAQAALRGSQGLLEDLHFPLRSKSYRGLLINWD